MRKIIVSMNITLDGFMSGPDNALDWHLDTWNEEMAICVTEQLSKADTILFGSVTYTAMENYWNTAVAKQNIAREDIAFATLLDNCKKIVFSKSMITTRWQNAIIVKRELKSELMHLQRGPGKHILVYGSGRLVKSLLKLDMVDEFSLWVHPVMIGNGASFFEGLKKRSALTLQYSKVFSSGVVLLNYRARQIR